MASETRPIDDLASCTITAGIAEVINKAKKVTDTLRALVTEKPRRNRNPDRSPPKRFPKPATAKGIPAYSQRVLMKKSRARLSYPETKKMKKNKTGPRNIWKGERGPRKRV